MHIVQHCWQASIWACFALFFDARSRGTVEAMAAIFLGFACERCRPSWMHAYYTHLCLLFVPGTSGRRPLHNTILIGTCGCITVCDIVGFWPPLT
ncbi:hypothetical protein GGR56DRAFT_202282 [Xylariaceae sp. FL0804]|nr:hypothetical protein GGR56DRAFT_202282 [Xylariaceae sp. FL0804]